MHIGVFILLLLSGERNFGVRLNKPYSVHVPMDIPVFTGTHADLLIVVRRRLTTLVFNRLACPPVPFNGCLFRRCFTRSSPLDTNVCSLSSTASSLLL